MDLAGNFSLAVPQRRAIAALHDAENLTAMLPAPSTVSQITMTEFDFVLQRSLGMMMFKLPGRIEIVPEVRGKRYLLTAEGKHGLAGGVTVALVLDFDEIDGRTDVTYKGQLEATGLAGRLLKERQGKVQGVLDAMFAALKTRLENAPPFRPTGPLTA